MTETSANGVTDTPIDMKQRQAPLRRRYVEQPHEAVIIDAARTSSRKVEADRPIHGEVLIGDETLSPVATGIHRAIGGDSDLPNPGEVLAAALASCLDGSIRIIANLMGVHLAGLEVAVAARVDVRGTLMVDRSVSVGFQDLKVDVKIDAPGVDAAKIDYLLKAAEQSCVVLQTLRNPPAVTVALNTNTALAA